MFKVRYKSDRGLTKTNWLTSYHSFSFGNYYEEKYRNFSVLRVINDDIIAPGKGFAPHSHQDMEIITYVTNGMVAHQDSLGNKIKIPAGDFQLMRAGSGITHSEYNPSSKEALTLLQIWILPNQTNLPPSYQQQHFSDQPGLCLIAAPQGVDGSIQLQQDAYLYRLQLDEKKSLDYSLKPSRCCYLHIVQGDCVINNHPLCAGDGMGVVNENYLTINATPGCEILLFDLPEEKY